MLGTVAASLAKTPLGLPPHQLALRIEGTARDGQVVRLSGAESTVGSGPECTLRLRARGVEPLHCTITHSTRGLSIQSRSPETWLNGASFEEAPLKAGDRLTVGPIRFVVLQSPSDGAARPATPRGARRERRPAGQRSTKHKGVAATAETPKKEHRPDRAWEETRQFVERERTSWESEKQRWMEDLAASKQRQAEANAAAARQNEQLRREAEMLRASCRQLEADQRRVEIEYNDLKSQLDLRRNDLAALDEQLRDHRSELAAETSGLQVKKQELEAESQRVHVLRDELIALREKLAEQQEKLILNQSELGKKTAVLDAREAELQSVRSEIEQRESRLNDRLADLEKKYSELERRDQESTRSNEELHKELVAEREQLVQRQNDFDAQRDAWEQERARLDQELAERNAEVDRQLAELREQREALAQQQKELETQRAAKGAEASAVAEMDTIKAEVARAEAALQTERAEYDAQRKAFEEDRRAFHTERAELKRDRIELDSRQQQLETECQRFDTERASLQEETSQLESYRAELDGQCRQLEQNRQELEDELLRLQHDTQPSADELAPQEAAGLGEGPAAVTSPPADEHSSLQSAINASDVLNQALRDEVAGSVGQAETVAAEPGGDSDKVEPAVPDHGAAALADASDNQALLESLRQLAFSEDKEASGVEPQSHDSVAGLGLADQPNGADTDFPTHGALASDESKAESIDQYMSRLLQRVSGPIQDESPMAIDQGEADIPAAVHEERPTALSGESKEMRPKHVAPEQFTSLAAMRELANFSANSAIQKSQRSRHAMAALKKVLIAIMALVMSCIMFVLSEDTNSIGFFAACVAFVAASLWAVQAAIFWGRVRADEDRKYAKKAHQASAQPAVQDDGDQTQRDMDSSSELPAEESDGELAADRSPKTEPEDEFSLS